VLLRSHADTVILVVHALGGMVVKLQSGIDLTEKWFGPSKQASVNVIGVDIGHLGGTLLDNE
jgi:hypothetical protein